MSVQNSVDRSNDRVQFQSRTPSPWSCRQSYRSTGIYYTVKLFTSSPWIRCIPMRPRRSAESEYADQFHQCPLSNKSQSTTIAPSTRLPVGRTISVRPERSVGFFFSSSCTCVIPLKAVVAVVAAGRRWSTSDFRGTRRRRGGDSGPTVRSLVRRSNVALFAHARA